jgi:hypothetical protein
MIKPTKYSDLNLSVVAISSEILQISKHGRFHTYDNVFSKILHKKGDTAKEVFIYALNFLFAMGLIDYHKKEDVIEFYETK